MSMTFKQQQDKLGRFLGDPNTTTDDQWPLADRQFELNRGELLFAKKSKSVLRRVDGTVASKKIPLPSDFGGVHIIQVDDIVMTSENEMPLADYDIYVNSGEDKYYFWVDSSGSSTRAINFISTSTNSKAYIMWYWAKQSTDLSADDDESLLEDEYREGPIHYAASQLLPQIGKLQLAAYHDQKYVDGHVAAEEETKSKVLTIIKAFPDIEPGFQRDVDIQGRGQIGCY